MNYVGIDIHKRYSVLVAVDEGGRELARGRVSGNTAFGFAQFFGRLEGTSKVVMEACWNWGRIHDLLEEIEQVEEVVLAHPLKTRLIDYATCRACFRSGEIRILNSCGAVERTIPFSEADRTL